MRCISKLNKKNKSDQYWKESVHTQLSYWFGVMAVGIQFVLGFRHITILFGQLNILEGFFGLSGLLLLDLIHGKKSKKKIYPEKFKKIHPNLFYRFAITFGVIALIQFIFQIVPLITSTEMALAIVFAPVCEEYFFRGILMEPTFRLGRNAKPDQKFTVWRYNPKKRKPAKEMSYAELGGILLSGVLFAGFHVNYYGQPRLIGMVLVGGWWLGLVYFWNKDLTAVILAHFLLNIFFVAQFYQVFL
ncbi:hypothetical protein LCGC14_0957730 [marine sediment metagenome]|uniref:CAAX prenyl protease 2/Lysostaphin resistance protein A-like domain-containing protein n=1 Tax=marine sediment metagenome TaxID=412755 RepID=A0A0F9NFA1_9ZZZZ